MSRAVRWTRQVVSHAPAVAAGFAVALWGGPAVAVAWFAASRLAYVGYVAVVLSGRTREGAVDGRAADLAWRTFSRRASWLMDNDAVAFAALCLATAGALDVPWSVWTTLAAGLVLVAVGVTIKAWAASSLAPGSYHWRDFFVPQESTGRSSAGPYRFLSNPMYTVGYAHAYGVALALRSPHGLFAAAAAQASILLLLLAVERPYFAKLAATRDAPPGGAAATTPEGERVA